MNGIPSPGTLHLYAADPNPNGAENSQLFLLAGQRGELDPGAAWPAAPNFQTSPVSNLHIYHFNDLHGHLTRFNREGEEAVLSRIAGKIQNARQECQGKDDSAVLVCSAGDDCSGSIFDELLTIDPLVEPLHPGYQLYSKMGVDAAGLGNHDFDRGLSFLAASIRHNAQFPVLAANLKGCAKISEVCHPAAILVIKGIRVGLIGLVTRAETRLDSEGCQIVHPIQTAQNLVPALRPHCEVLIIISHLGYSLDSPIPTVDAGDVEIANSLPPGSVDLIIGGHSHSALNRDGLDAENIVNGIPIVQTGARGEFLGQVDLLVCQNSTKVTMARLIPIASLPVNRDFENTEVYPFIAKIQVRKAQYLGRVDDNPDLSTAVVVNDFAKHELALANFFTDALVKRLNGQGFKVDCAMIDASSLQCGLPLSDSLTYGDCFEIMPYTDTIRLYQITGRQLQDLLADNALRIDRSDEFKTERGFLQFSREIEYTIHLGKTRIDACAVNMNFRGTPLEMLAEVSFMVATTCFTRKLAAPWEAQWNRTRESPLLDLHQFPFTETDISMRQEIVTYIQEHGGVDQAGGANCDGRLRVEASPGNPPINE